MKTIDSISKDYQIIEQQQQGKIFGGQKDSTQVKKEDPLVTVNMRDTFVGRNGDVSWYMDDGSYLNTYCP